MSLIDDINDSPLTKPTPDGGNHPLWCAGHLAYSERHLVNVDIKGNR